MTIHLIPFGVMADSTPADVTATTGNTLTVATPSGIFTLA